jgi:hypothetical protein
MSAFSKFFPNFTAGQGRYLAGSGITTSIPKYLACDGSIVSQTTYPNLFSQVGLLENGLDNWTQRNPQTTGAISALTYGDNLYVYAGASGVLATSTNAITWTARTSGTTSAINALTYGDNLYVYAGNGGVLATSTDAITWTARTSGTANAINALTYGNNLYVYGGAGGALATSTDAITWTVRTSGTTSFINALTYGDNLYVYAGLGGLLATAAKYTYNTATEFVLPLTKQIVSSAFTSQAFIKES